MTARAFSTAVVSRRVEPADSLDYFPTPPWATRAFCRYVLPAVYPHPDVYAGAAWDPCCGEGHMAVALGEFFDVVGASDIHPYGFGEVGDFLAAPAAADLPVPSWIVMNPPFNRALEFIRHGLSIAGRGVAVLVRTAFLEGQGRHAGLFKARPPQLVAQYVERVPMHKGRWVPDGKSATAYCWLVWLTNPPHDWRHTRMFWIPPCRKALTDRDDARRFNAAAPVPLLEGPATMADVRAAVEARL